MSKPKLMWVSDNPHFSFVGQAIVTRQVLERLSEHYDVESVGYYIPMAPNQSIMKGLPYDVHVVERYKPEKILQIVQKSKPDILFLSHDVFLFKWLPELRRLMPDLKIVGWFTIDGEPLPLRWQGVLEACDVVISPTRYGKSVVQEGVMYLPVEVVPYGVDHEVFQPRVSGKSEVIDKLLERGIDVRLPEDQCYFVFWGHNQSKKNIPAIVDAWRKAQVSAQCLLVLHSHHVLRGDWQYLGDWDWRMERRPPGISVLDGTYTDEVISLFARMSDVLVFPSIGEGFGMPIVESMASGVIPITTNYAGPTDFCEHMKNSFLLSPTFIAGDFNIRRGVVDIDELAQCFRLFVDLYSRQDTEGSVFSKMRQEAIKTSQQFDWDITSEKILNIVDRILSSKYDRRWRTFQIN